MRHWALQLVGRRAFHRTPSQRAPCYLTGSREGDNELHMIELRQRLHRAEDSLCQACSLLIHLQPKALQKRLEPAEKEALTRLMATHRQHRLEDWASARKALQDLVPSTAQKKQLRLMKRLPQSYYFLSRFRCPLDPPDLNTTVAKSRRAKKRQGRK